MKDKKPKKQPEDIYIKVGARIREVRMADGTTQVDFAKFLGVTFQQVQKYERGTNRVSLFQLIKVARKFKFDCGEFLNSLRGEVNNDSTHCNTVDLVRMYKELDKEDQEMVFSTVAVIAQNKEVKDDI